MKYHRQGLEKKHIINCAKAFENKFKGGCRVIDYNVAGKITIIYS